MKALRFHGQRDLRIDDIDEPTAGPGEVKIKVDWCGLCGSDLHEYLAGPIFVPTKDNPHPVTGGHLPLVMGHEFAGMVADVGEGVTRVAAGDAVAVEPLVYDETCYACQKGWYNVCSSVGFHGLSGGGGGLAEYTVVPEKMVHQLPAGMETDIGALIEPIAVGWHAAKQGNFQPGDKAVIFGAGPIGLVTMLSLRAAGAEWVAVSEVSSARKEAARKFGADLVLDPTNDDVAAEVARLTGPGADVAYECTGNGKALTTAMQSVRPHGTVCNVAIWEGATDFNPNDVILNETTMASSLAYCDDYPTVMALIDDGRLETDGLITSRITLDEVVEHGFEELVNNKDQHIKILVDPS